jgi:hypothetical protein
MFSGWRLALWFACSGVVWLGYRSGSPALLWGALLVLLPAYVPGHLWSRRFIKQVMEIRNESSQAQSVHAKRFHTWMAGERKTLEAWSVPPSMTSLHRALLLSVSVSAKGPVSGRIRSMISQRRFIEQLIRQRKARQREGAERAFLVQAEAWWATSQEWRAAHRREGERSLSMTMTRLQRLHPPPSLRGLHEALREALRAEYVAQATLRQAIDNGDLERAIAAYDELLAAHAKVKDMLVGALKVARQPRTDLIG